MITCDQPGCKLPATSITQVTGKNTPTKTWYACEMHKPAPKENDPCAIDETACPAIGVYGIHSDAYYDDGMCQWCGSRQ